MKRILLSLVFVAALAAGGLGLSSKASAGHGCYDGGYGYYGGYRSYPVFYSGWGYPRYYRSYYPRHSHRSHWHGHHGHGHHDHGGFHFSIGF